MINKGKNYKYMKKLAIAVPTYNRDKDIKFFLESEFFLSKKDSTDVLIFDSSEKDSTKNVVHVYKNKGFKNLMYNHVDSSVPSNEKLFNIYEQLADSYEFIWVLHDHTVFNEEAFDFLLENLNKDTDFYFLKTQCRDFKVKSYESLNDFFYESAWLLGKMGASVVNSQSFIKGINWGKYKKKFLAKKLLNFSHIGLYFERASEIEEFKPVTLEFPRELFCDTHKYEKLSWEKEVVRICTQCWGMVISSLSDSYTNKSEVLMSIDAYFLTKYKLIEYRGKGFYNIFEYLKYRKWMKKTLPNLCHEALKIALRPCSALKKIYSKEILDEINAAKADNRKVYIYGAGKHGIECLDFLEYCEAPIDGFLVTSKKGNPDDIRNYPVCELSDVIEKDKIFAILAVMDELKKEIIEVIKSQNNKGKDIMWKEF